MAEINQTELNKFNTLIKKKKEYIDQFHPEFKGDDDKKNSCAVSMSILQEYYKVDNATAYGALTEGGGDCGIDAFYYDQTKNLSELVLIQSKYKNIPGATGTFEDADIDNITNSARKILFNHPLDNPNENLTNKLSKYKEILKEEGYPKLRITIFFATNGVIAEGHKTRSSVTDIEAENSTVVFVDASKFTTDKNPSKAELKINVKPINNTDATDTVFNQNGIVCSTSVKNLIEFYRSAGGPILLERNVRFALAKSAINKEIKNSFLSHPENFCFLNNGIYIACSKYEVESTGHDFSKIVLYEPSIVNGGQTITSLDEIIRDNNMLDGESARKANVLIRIYKENTALSIADITKATNSQNAIDLVDLEANNIKQNQVKGYFEMKGVGLLVKDGEDTVYYNDTINNEELLQLYSAIYKDDPALARSSKKSIFKKYFKTLFEETEDISSLSEDLYRCYQLRTFLYGKKSSLTKENQAILDNIWHSILYMMSKINPHITNPKSEITIFEDAFNKSWDILMSIIDTKRTELGVHFSLNNLFKSKLIKDIMDSKIEQPETNNVPTEKLPE